MGSKERIQRQKEDNRSNILIAALQIVKQEGWQALSMRKIADIIEYTAPIIYEYFENKEAILNELSIQGFRLLAKKVSAAKAQESDLEKQLESMWFSYWDFAFEERELYQLMFGVGTPCCAAEKTKEAVDTHRILINDVISEIMKEKKADQNLVCRKYFTYWSVIHGLISINMVNQGNGEITNQQVLKDAIYGITRTLTD